MITLYHLNLWALAQVLVAPVQIHSSANTSGKSVESGPSIWAPFTHIVSSSWLQPSPVLKHLKRLWEYFLPPDDEGSKALIEPFQSAKHSACPRGAPLRGNAFQPEHSVRSVSSGAHMPGGHVAIGREACFPSQSDCLSPISTSELIWC